MRIDYSTLKKVAKEFGHDFQIEAGFEPGTSDLKYMLWQFGHQFHLHNTPMLQSPETNNLALPLTHITNRLFDLASILSLYTLLFSSF